MVLQKRLFPCISPVCSHRRASSGKAVIFSRYRFLKRINENCRFSFQTAIVYSNCVRPSKLKRYQSLLFVAGKNIYKGHDAPQKYTEACNGSVMLLFKRSIEDITLFYVATTMMGVLPIYLYFFYDKKELIFPFILPFTDPATHNGYLINQIHHAIYAFVGICGMRYALSIHTRF